MTEWAEPPGGPGDGHTWRIKALDNIARDALRLIADPSPDPTDPSPNPTVLASLIYELTVEVRALAHEIEGS